MKRSPVFKSLLAALFLTAFFSCQNQFDVPIDATVMPHKVSISEAKAWIVKEIPTHQLQTQGEILWNLAEETDLGGVPLLTVPMMSVNQNEQLLTKKDGQFTKSLVSTQRILFYTDAKGNPKASLIKTENGQNENLKNYTGNLYFFDPKTNTIQAIWQLKSGSFAGSNHFGEAAANARTNCTWEMYTLACGDQCTGQLGGADNGGYLPEPGNGCCWKYQGCGGGPSGPSNPTTPIPDPFGAGGLGSGGVLGGGGWSGGVGGGIFGNNLSLAEYIFVSRTIWEWKALGADIPQEQEQYIFSHPWVIEDIKNYIKEFGHSVPNRPSLGIVGNMIRNYLESKLEKDMFERWWLGHGDYHMKGFEFLEMVNEGRFESVNGTTHWNNIPAQAELWSWYHSENYDEVIGRGTIYRKLDGNNSIFGFFDIYDFDSKAANVRTPKAEVKTRVMDSFRPATARPFKIYFP